MENKEYSEENPYRQKLIQWEKQPHLQAAWREFADEFEREKHERELDRLMKADYAPSKPEPKPEPTEPVELRSLKYGLATYREMQGLDGEKYFEMEFGTNPPRTLDITEIRFQSDSYPPVARFLQNTEEKTK